jgi:glycerophosphoryl diester phosphodiesterase
MRDTPGILGAAAALPSVIGHRGAGTRAPENTLAGLRQAHALGCRWVEFDVRLTAEGELVLLHDKRLERTTTGFGKVRALPLAAIRRVDAGVLFGEAFAGERVPTLTEAISVLGELGLGANIEIKSGRRSASAAGATAAEAVSRSWPARAPPPLLSSFLPQALAAARDRAPRVARGLLLRKARGRWRSLAAASGCATIHIDHRALQRSTVAEIRAEGYPVLAYTVNDPERAVELLRWGVTSVFSDVPDTILAAIAADPSRAAAALPSAAALRAEAVP